MSSIFDMPEVDESKIETFKRDLIGACPSLVTFQEQRIVRSFPDEVFATVLSSIYGNDNTLARDIMYNRFDRINIDDAEAEINRIKTLEPAGIVVADAMSNSTPILLISDDDGDGNTAQAIAWEASKITDCEMTIRGSEYESSTHGFGIPQIMDWVDGKELDHDSEFLVMVTDLGTNQIEEQKQFQSLFPNAKLVVIDHHEPIFGMMIEHTGEENKNIHLVSPYVEGSMKLAMNKGGGVAGGFLAYKVFKNAIDELIKRGQLSLEGNNYKHRMDPLRELGRVSNLIDGVLSNPALKPLREADIKKALDISSSTMKGKSFGKWLRSSQVSNIVALGSLIGQEGVDNFLELRNEVLEQNHIAKALYDLIQKIVEPELDKKDKPVYPEIPYSIAESIAYTNKEDSADVNYISLLKTYVFNFNYENQYVGSVKKVWLDYASLVLKRAGKIESSIVEKIRDYKLVEGISADHVTLSRATSSLVSKAFTTKQIAKAYKSLTKSVMLAVSRNEPGEMVLSYQSKVPMVQVVNAVKETLAGMDFELRGHSHVGGLTIKTPAKLDPMVTLKLVAGQIDIEAKKIRDLESLDAAIMIKPVHLPIVSEVLKKMRVHLETQTAPKLLMKMDSDMIFQDKYSLKKRNAEEIVRDDEWGISSEHLDFAMTSSLTIPNQAMKYVINESYNAALSVTLLPNGSYITTDVVSSEQLNKFAPKELEIPRQRERDEILHEYQTRFASLDVPLVKVPRKAAMDALKFTNSGKKVFEISEAAILGIMNKHNADSYCTLDVEGDGASDAECSNVGFCIAKKVKGSGKFLTADEFGRLISKEPGEVRNFKDTDGGYVVNERIQIHLFSVVINGDGEMELKMSLKSQGLTNMDSEFIKSGVDAKEAQKLMKEVLGGLGKFIVQAHNLPYDNNIIRVNFPEIYEMMKGAIHLDSAPLAKNHQIAYTNVQVTTVGKHEFFNAEHKGYNLTTMLKGEEDFRFPSIKGTVVLYSVGDSLYIEDLKTRTKTLLKETKSELAETSLSLMKPMSSPRYGIAKLLKMAALHDMISHQPVKQIVKLNYENFGFSDFPEHLWNKFQDNYAYDLTPAQNVAKFSVIPEVREVFEEEIKMDYKEVDKDLLDSRSLVHGDKYNPNVKLSTKKSAEAQAKIINNFKASDAFHANAMRFVNANHENAERFARSWVYELVFSHHEATTKNLAASFISGVSDMTGVDKKIVAKSYDELYVYKKFRGIKSYMVHETHNNVGLNGDVFQELNVFIYMLYLKLRNPHLDAKDGLRIGVNFMAPVIDALASQSADSSIKQVIRNVSGIVLDEDLLNTYGAKKLDSYSEKGISIASSRSGVAKMRCKTLSTNTSVVNIELPNISAEHYRKLTPEQREKIESKIEEVVTVLILSNSKKSEDKMKGNDAKISMLIDRVAAHPDVLENMREVQEMFGTLIPTERDHQIKNIMKSCADAILGKAPLKLPINKHLPKEDLLLLKDAVEESSSYLAQEQNFESHLSQSELDEAFELAIVQFTAFENMRVSGENKAEVDGYGPVPTSTKSELTKTFNIMNKVLAIHIDACPDLANYVTTAKTKPVDFLLKSPLVSKLISKYDLSNDLKMELKPEVENKLENNLENEVEDFKLRVRK